MSKVDHGFYDDVNVMVRGEGAMDSDASLRSVPPVASGIKILRTDRMDRARTPLTDSLLSARGPAVSQLHLISPSTLLLIIHASRHNAATILIVAA